MEPLCYIGEGDEKKKIYEKKIGNFKYSKCRKWNSAIDNEC